MIFEERAKTGGPLRIGAGVFGALGQRGNQLRDAVRGDTTIAERKSRETNSGPMTYRLRAAANARRLRDRKGPQKLGLERSEAVGGLW